MNAARARPSRRPLLKGLFVRLMMAFIIVVLTVAALVTWLAGRATQQGIYLYTTMAGRMQAGRLAPYLAEYYQAMGSWEGVEGALAFEEAQMMGPPGNPVARRNQGMWQMMGMQILVVGTNGQIAADSSGELTGRQVDAAGISAGAPIWVKGVQVGTVLLTVPGLSPAENDQFMHQVNRAIVLAALVASLVALLLGGLITWGVTRPVSELTRAAEAIAAGDLSQRVRAKPGDEVGDLATAFNQMAAQLERAESLRRQLTADIAHELRTPLAVIQGNVEALQDGVFPLTTDALEPIQAKTALLSRLVEDLRQLALAETGRLPLDRRPTDLLDLARRSATAFRPAAEAQSISLTIESQGELPAVEADPQRIEQVLVNLLSNALRHTPLGGQVRVQVLPGSAGRLVVRVSDTGPGIPPEALPNVFERFYRVDKSRARSNDREGSGLGLAVARSIIRAHGGEIAVDSPPGQGATFWFSLPVAAGNGVG